MKIITSYPSLGTVYHRSCQVGDLRVTPSELCLEPPSRKHLGKLCALADLRARTQTRGAAFSPQVHVQSGRDGNNPAETLASSDRNGDNSVDAFLRYRVLPAGPWECSPLFGVWWPRPCDWGRAPMSAGEIKNNSPLLISTYFTVATTRPTVGRDSYSQTLPYVSCFQVAWKI